MAKKKEDCKWFKSICSIYLEKIPAALPWHS